MMGLVENSSLWGLRKKGKGKVSKCPTHCPIEKAAFGCSGQATVRQKDSTDFKEVFSGSQKSSHIIKQV